MKVLGRGPCYVIRAADEVMQHLKVIREKHKKHFFNAREILEKLMDVGLEGVNNTEQFTFEGRFPDGTPNGSRVAIYAVKAYQLRIYGGFRIVEGEESFVCIESVIKKANKADQKQLKRVAKKLGKHGSNVG